MAVGDERNSEKMDGINQNNLYALEASQLSNFRKVQQIS